MHCHIVIIPGDADITPPPKINPRICIRSGASQTLLLGGSHTLAQWRVVDSLIVLAFLLHRIGRSLDFVVSVAHGNIFFLRYAFDDAAKRSVLFCGIV